MNRSTYHTGHLTLAIVAALLLLVAACGATATPTTTPVPTTTTTTIKLAPTTVTIAPTATSAPAGSAAAPSPSAALPTLAAVQPTLTPVATIPPVANTVSFAADILPLFQSNCVRCHGGASPRSGMSLETYQNAMKGGIGAPDIIPGDPEKSLLYVYPRDGVMPFGGPKLSAADVQKIYNWIKAGALNN
jgi:cytochrome c